MRHRFNGRTLIATCALAVALLALTLVGRGRVVNDKFEKQQTTDTKLCRAILTIVLTNDPRTLQPGDPGFSYYLRHPSELEEAINRNDAALRLLPCQGDVEKNLER